MQLQNKTALITGAGRGIGFAFARRYVEEGARITIADVDVDRTQAAAETIGSQAIAVEMDVADQNSIRLGVVDGDHWDGVDAFFAKYEGKPKGQKRREVGDAVPYGRMGQPEDLTAMAVFLASEGADYIVAQTCNVDGRNWMS